MEPIFTSMNFLDFLLIIPIAWFAYKGFNKGLIMEIFSLLALVLGIYACLHFTDWTTTWLKETFSESWATMAVFVYIVTFVAAFAAVYFSGKLVEKLFGAGGMGIANKLSGGFFGAAKAALLISGLLVAINSINSKKDFLGADVREKSFLYDPLSDLSALVIPAFRNTDWASFDPDKL